MSVIDDSGTGSIDGKKFCNAFFRLGNYLCVYCTASRMVTNKLLVVCVCRSIRREVNDGRNN